MPNVKNDIMRKLMTLLILVSSLISCNQKRQDNSAINALDKKFGEKLLNADFLKYADFANKDSIENEILNSFYIYDERSFKFSQVDAEELAEFNFDFFLPTLNKILEKRNVHLNIELSKDYEKTNDIIINGEKINLYTESDLNKEIFWDTAPKNFFKKVNEILQKKDCNEQIYLLYDGNDLSSLLLTKEQFEIIRERYIKEKTEIPYLP